MSGIIVGSADTPQEDLFFPLTSIIADDQYGIIVPTIYGDEVVRRVTGITENGQLGFLATASDDELVVVKQFIDIDYLLVRYSWEAAGGTDLDTRTWVNDPPIDFVVGWGRGTSDAYITWGGDNTGSVATEAVLVDFKNVLATYPAQEVISVRTGAFWYGSRGTGDITMSLLAYKGGTMQQVGTDFINVGGTLIDTLTAPRNVVTQTTSASSNGDFLGYARYDILNRTFTYTAP